MMRTYIIFVCIVAATTLSIHLLWHTNTGKTPKYERPSVPSARHCAFVLNKQNKKQIYVQSGVLEPPWFELMNETGAGDNGLNHTAHTGNLYVTGGGEGRFGNHMFIYATLFGTAWRNRRVPIWWDNSLKLCDVFHCRIPGDHMSVASRRADFTQLSEAGAGIYNKLTEHLPDKNVTLVRYLQSWKYFIHVEDQLRHDFTFHPETIDAARRMLDAHVPPTWRNSSITRVVTHVRRTDYAGVLDLDRDYFIKSMSYFTDCLPRVQFIIISDDLSWCRQNIVGVGDKNVVFLEEAKTAVEALAVASLCDHAIITIGTFGWWAAWLANGVTIASKNYPSKTRDANIYNRDDYYKPDFIMF